MVTRVPQAGIQRVTDSRMTRPGPLKRGFWRDWSPAVAWCGLIFLQSAFPTPDVLPHWANLDKAIHAGVYAVLAVLMCHGLYSLPGWRQHTLRICVCGALFAALYGASDEWHQSFVAGRTADVLDWLADLVGAVAGSGLYMYARRRLSRLESLQRRQQF